MPIPTKIYWMDRDIDTLSREELMEIIRLQLAMIETGRETTRRIIDIHEAGLRARRG